MTRRQGRKSYPTPRQRTLQAVAEFATIGQWLAKTEPIRSYAPLWTNERRFRSRRYHAWDRACSVCGTKVVVSEALKREIDAERRQHSSVNGAL